MRQEERVSEETRAAVFHAIEGALNEFGQWASALGRKMHDPLEVLIHPAPASNGTIEAALTAHEAAIRADAERERDDYKKLLLYIRGHAGYESRWRAIIDEHIARYDARAGEAVGTHE